MLFHNRNGGIVTINQDSGYLMIDLLNAIAEKNKNITLITGRLVVRNKSLNKNVRVRRIIRYKRNSTLNRLWSWTIGFLQILLLVKFKHRKDHLLIVTNPPTATFLPLLCKNRFSLLIFDIYPDALTNLGIISKKSLLARFWVKANKKIFVKADNVFTLTESMANLLKRYSGSQLIKIVPLWSSGDFCIPFSKQTNPFSILHNLADRFVVMYSGNLGATHNIEVLIELAQRVKNPKIIFLIIGEGDRKKYLEEKVRNLKLSNFLLLPLQPVDRIPYSFNSADIAVVSLSANASELSLPSKTYSYMSSGLPLLCIAGEKSELKKLIKKYNNGVCFTTDKLDEIAAFIEEMARNEGLLNIYKTNSLKAAQSFTAINADIIVQSVGNSVIRN